MGILTPERSRSLPLANGHGRCITATPERTPVSVGEWTLHAHARYKFVTVLLLEAVAQQPSQF